MFSERSGYKNDWRIPGRMKPPFLLALIALVLFAGHQLSQKALGWRVAWADNYLDNLLCMPILLAGLLLERHWLLGRLRLSLAEVLIASAVVSFVSEYLFPRFSDAFTADWWDVAAYFAGGLLFFKCQPQAPRAA